MEKRRYLSAAAAGVLTLLLGILLTLLVEYLETRRYEEFLHADTINQLSQVRANLETGINADIYLTRGLIAFVATHPDLDQDTFHCLAGNLLQYRNSIRNIGLAPGNIISFIHPVQGNEKALGLDYQKNTIQWPAVKRAIELRQTVVAGPVNLVQGGTAFISRTPIYIDSRGSDKDGRYWGLASIVIDKEKLFQGAGVNDGKYDIKIAIRGIDATGVSGGLIDGDPAVFKENPVTLDVVLPGGSWQLAAVPQGGWGKQSPNIPWIQATGGVLSLLLGLVAFFWLWGLIRSQQATMVAKKKAEMAARSLRKNQNFLQAVYENIPNMIFVKDATDLRFISINRAGEELTGYSRKELLGKNDYDFFPEQQADFFTAHDREVLTERQRKDIAEERIETKNFGTRILHTKKIPLFDEDGTPLYLLGISEDITERKQTDEQIKKDAQGIEILLDLHKNAPQLQGRELYSYALEKAVELTESEIGYIHALEEIDGKTIIVLTQWNKEARQQCSTASEDHYPLADAGIWADSIRLKKPVIHNNYQEQKGKKGYPDGHFPLIRHLGIPVIDKGEVKLVFGVGNKPTAYSEGDVSHIQLIANELQKLLTQKRFIREQTHLEQQLKQAQKMEAIGLLAGGVAHDLNNILSGVVGYPELILRDLPQESELRKPIEDIRESGQRAATVVADLLTVARSVASSRELHDINALAREYLSSPEYKNLQSLHPKISCVELLHAARSTIFCSSVHVKKCLMNLVTNAMEALGDTGQVEIITANRTVEETSTDDHSLTSGEYVVLTVRDNGPGIAEHDLEHVFEPFYTKKVLGRSGSGLGLAVVWNTMEEHGGKVTVESSAQGTSFYLYFPLGREDQAPSVEQETEDSLIGNNEHILVVDDEPQLRDLACKMLRMQGYLVDSVCSGELAVEFVRENPVDLLVLDMLMEPGMNGYQTFEAILQLYPQQKAIVASGFSESDDVKAAIRLGARGFVKKPYSIEELARAVKKALAGEPAPS